jgi:hypothetical protein
MARRCLASTHSCLLMLALNHAPPPSALRPPPSTLRPLALGTPSDPAPLRALPFPSPVGTRHRSFKESVTPPAPRSMLTWQSGRSSSTSWLHKSACTSTPYDPTVEAALPSSLFAPHKDMPIPSTLPPQPLCLFLCRIPCHRPQRTAPPQPTRRCPDTFPVPHTFPQHGCTPLYRKSCMLPAPRVRTCSAAHNHGYSNLVEILSSAHSASYTSTFSNFAATGLPSNLMPAQQSSIQVMSTLAPHLLPPGAPLSLPCRQAARQRIARAGAGPCKAISQVREREYREWLWLRQMPC